MGPRFITAEDLKRVTIGEYYGGASVNSVMLPPPQSPPASRRRGMTKSEKNRSILVQAPPFQSSGMVTRASITANSPELETRLS
jgi:hypothetical protein